MTFVNQDNSVKFNNFYKVYAKFDYPNNIAKSS